jgi:hypothetical protein
MKKPVIDSFDVTETNELGIPTACTMAIHYEETESENEE